MLKWIKYLIGKIPEDMIMSLLEYIYGILPIEKWIEALRKFLMEQAKKTENEVDDNLVDIICDLLLRAFGIDKEIPR